MAGHLVAAGHEVVVWNRTAGKTVSGAQVAPDLAALSQSCGVIMICVNRTEDVEEVLGNLLPGLQPGTVVIDHSTIEPSAAPRMTAAVEKAGGTFLDAPITGGSMGAERGTLTIFCGGPESTFRIAEPFLQAYGKTVEHVGPSGSGYRMKLANQVGVVGALFGLCESLAFARKCGLDLPLTHQLLAGGAAGSWAIDNYGPKILKNDWSPGFSIQNQLKDLRYCLEVAGEHKMALRLTALSAEILQLMVEEGRGEEATAAMFEKLLEF